MPSLPEPLATYATNFIGEHCYSELVGKLNIQNVPCLKLLVSKGLSLGVIAGSLLYKVPQILKIKAAAAKSKVEDIEKLSLSMFVFELVTLITNIAYNLQLNSPFSTYGENVFIVVQNFIILNMIWLYNSNRRFLTTASIAICSAFGYAMLTGIVSAEHINLFQQANVYVFAASRIPQIISNFKTRDVGAQSAVTAFMAFAGSAARVFTTMQEVSDATLLRSAIIAASLNAILFAQVALFTPKKTEVKAKKVQ